MTEAQARTILSRLARNEPLDQICVDDTMPNKWAVYSLIQERPDFRKAYLAAKRKGIDLALRSRITAWTEARA